MTNPRPDPALTLAAHGVVPGPEGYDLDDLERLAARHGWRLSVDSVNERSRTSRYRAMVRRVGGAASLMGLPETYLGRGATEEAALVEALVKALARSATDPGL